MFGGAESRKNVIILHLSKAGCSGGARILRRNRLPDIILYAVAAAPVIAR
jgi:hypothetical protein